LSRRLRRIRCRCRLIFCLFLLRATFLPRWRGRRLTRPPAEAAGPWLGLEDLADDSAHGLGFLIVERLHGGEVRHQPFQPIPDLGLERVEGQRRRVPLVPGGRRSRARGSAPRASRPRTGRGPRAPEARALRTRGSCGRRRPVGASGGRRSSRRAPARPDPSPRHPTPSARRPRCRGTRGRPARPAVVPPPRRGHASATRAPVPRGPPERGRAAPRREWWAPLAGRRTDALLPRSPRAAARPPPRGRPRRSRSPPGPSWEAPGPAPPGPTRAPGALRWTASRKRRR
jgi:hypothetical protein